MNKELQNRAAEIKGKAEEKETARIEQLVSEQARDFYFSRFAEFLKEFDEKSKLAEKIRIQVYEDLKERENIISEAIAEETEKKRELRRKEIEAKLEHDRIEKLKNEEAQQKKLEEEKRIAEQERRTKLEAERSQIEAEKRRREEEIRKIKVEEKKRIKDEKELKIQAILKEAEEFYDKGNIEQALVQTAKALIHDPEHPLALSLYKKIKEPNKVTESDFLEKEIKEKETPITKSEKELLQEKRNDVKPEPVIIEREPLKPDNGNISVETSEFSDRGRVKSKIPLFITLIILILITVGIISYKYLSHIFQSTPSIAVLPFKSADGILEDDILGKGLSIDLIMRLASVENFKPIGIASSLYLHRQTDANQKEIYRFGFNYILTGTISRIKDTKQIDIELIDSLGIVYWKNSYSVTGNKFNVLPVEICENLIKEFRIQQKNEDISASRVSTFDNHAYSLYLRGLELLHRGDHSGVKNAEALFKQAIDLDNSFAEAYSAAGYSSIIKLENNWSTPQLEFEKAEYNIQKSLDIFKNLPSARRNKGLLFAYTGKFKTAHEEITKAIDLAPNDSRNYLALSNYYIITGLYKDAIEVLTIAENLDPYHPGILEKFAGVYQLTGNNKSALEKYSKALMVIPDTLAFVKDVLSNVILFDTELQMGNINRIVSKYYQKIEGDPRNYIDRYKLARTYQVIGRKSEAMPILSEARALLQSEYYGNSDDSIRDMYLALIFTRLGKFPEAKRYADQSYNRNPNDVYILYMLARMYSIQNKLDLAEEKLKKAVIIHFDLNEILDIDLFNLRNSDKFIQAIKWN